MECPRLWGRQKVGRYCSVCAGCGQESRRDLAFEFAFLYSMVEYQFPPYHFDNSIIRDEYTVHIGKMNDSANIALSVDTAHKLLDLCPNGDHDLIRRSEIAGQNISMNDLKFYRRGRKIRFKTVERLVSSVGPSTIKSITFFLAIGHLRGCVHRQRKALHTLADNSHCVSDLGHIGFFVESCVIIASKDDFTQIHGAQIICCPHAFDASISSAWVRRCKDDRIAFQCFQRIEIVRGENQLPLAGFCMIRSNSPSRYS